LPYDTFELLSSGEGREAMGTWGPGPFENDDAVDFLGDLRDGNLVQISERLNEFFELVLKVDQHVEAREMSVAVAAAALVAIWSGAPEPSNRGIQEVLASIPYGADDDQRVQAARVLDRAFVAQDNDWYATWVEDGSIDAVRDTLAPYRQALP
jgi:hypothetical protein